MIIKDSSIWKMPISKLTEQQVNRIDIGIVIDEKYSEEIQCVIYYVEVYSGYRRSVIPCMQMVKSGDFYNYEEIKLRNKPTTNNKNSNPSFSSRLGEIVLVAFISGIGTSGVIIGSVRHPARKTKLTTKEVAYISEYNGLETSIDNNGAWKIKFQGTPTNIKDIKEGSPLPAPKYDDKVSGSFYSIEKDGTVLLSDAEKEKPQTIKIDKINGSLSIISGDVSMVIDKKSKKISIKCEELSVESKNKTTIKSAEFSVDSSKSVKIKGQKIAIGYGSNELLDILTNLIDEIGMLTIISPVGACTPIQGSPTWTKILALKTKISTIKGGL